MITYFLLRELSKLCNMTKYPHHLLRNRMPLKFLETYRPVYHILLSIFFEIFRVGKLLKVQNLQALNFHPRQEVNFLVLNHDGKFHFYGYTAKIIFKMKSH